MRMHALAPIFPSSFPVKGIRNPDINVFEEVTNIQSAYVIDLFCVRKYEMTYVLRFAKKKKKY